MTKATLNRASEILSPSEEQKERMFRNILEVHTGKSVGQTPQKTRPIHIYKKLMPIAACLALMLSITTIANAATGGAIFNGIKQFLFYSGTEITMQETDVGFNVGVGKATPSWFVKESWGQLIFSANGESIDITDSISNNGFYYYTYTDNYDILHRVYIIKNVGEEGSERPYSQIEWIPEIGIGSTRGCGTTLAHVIGEVESRVKHDNASELDAVLAEYLQFYWNELANYDAIFESIGQQTN